MNSLRIINNIMNCFKKIASQDALRSLISEEAWKRYLDLDAVGNELESFRLETMYLAGAADYEKLFK